VWDQLQQGVACCKKRTFSICCWEELDRQLEGGEDVRRLRRGEVKRGTFCGQREEKEEVG
jgi:hypothetical protein